MCKLILVRGIPGSGKSTFTKRFKDFVHIESDQFCMQDGKFVWKPEDHIENQRRCWSATRDSLKSGKNVVVAATFTKKEDIRKYKVLAKSYADEMIVFRMTGGIQERP